MNHQFPVPSHHLLHLGDHPHLVRHRLLPVLLQELVHLTVQSGPQRCLDILLVLLQHQLLLRDHFGLRLSHLLFHGSRLGHLAVQHFLVIMNDFVEFSSIFLRLHNFVVVLLKVKLINRMSHIVLPRSCQCSIFQVHRWRIELFTGDLAGDLRDLGAQTLRELKCPIVGVEGRGSVLEFSLGCLLNHRCRIRAHANLLDCLELGLRGTSCVELVLFVLIGFLIV